ncbi:PREDICTED: MKI67 FHA domain-interacting nucleolar phosphoprotein [Camelina sativa]|uniref:MKI67 FHA domain-interacting nucleolar phosphoprotein n=1 Tax=Camelina sativa TaxID=90675 RepID=A0ABM0V818_CAMSA|nr:PREDICTED: MKI67 FHA domain-interacting nucleolar phosphoprotein [Camelina sativa]
MGAKAKKALKKNMKKISASAASSQLPLPQTPTPKPSADFLPLEGGPARKAPVTTTPLETKATVLYIGRIPHGFYETEIEAFFSQFGTVKRVRVARNKKTGKSKHFGFIQFEDPEVAEIAAGAMNDYLLMEHMLKVHVIPPEHVKPNLWKGFKCNYKPVDWVQIERKQHNKERTLEEHRKMLQKVVKKDQKRRKRIEAAGIQYECPELVGNTQPVPKKIKFSED